MQTLLERTDTTSSDLRRNLSDVLNASEYRKPQFFHRNRSVFCVLSRRDIGRITSTAMIEVTVDRQPDKTIATSDTLQDLVSWGKDEGAAVEAFCRDLMVYAEEYYENFELYSNSPGRSAHIPYVFRALAADSIEDVKEMLEVRYA